MNFEQKYKKKIDEIEEYMEYLWTMFDEIQTPFNNSIDEVQTPFDNDIEEVSTPDRNNLDEVKTPASYDSDLKAQSKKRSSKETQRKALSEEQWTQVKAEVEDWLFDYLIYAYIMGVEACEEMTGKSAEVDVDKMARAVNYDEALGTGTWRESLNKHLDDGHIGLAENLAETEVHRVVNTGILDSAKAQGAKYKTWKTMGDERVRDSHVYLEGRTIPLKEEFFTYNGDHGMHPGDFKTAEENCNCRCYLHIS